MPLGKPQRLRLFFETLQTAPATATAEAAFATVCDTLNRIEDTHSGIPSDPMHWKSDGRLYPPQEDSRKSFAPDSSLVRYRTRGNYLWIAPNGAILITDLNNPPNTVFTKPGADGVSVGTLPNG